MPHFYNKNLKYVLSVNLKVMYSTLIKQKSLKLIIQKKYEFNMILIKLSGHIKFYLLVRNPYDRLESFYKDKFINHPNTTAFSEGYNWQHSQKIFFPFFNINLTDSFDTVRKRLPEISFSDFIRVLPHVYKRDAHLIPQYKVENIKMRSYVVARIKYDRVLKLENPETPDFLNSIGIDTVHKYNSTQHIPGHFHWDQESREIVNTIYRQDFLKYDYQFLHS